MKVTRRFFKRLNNITIIAVYFLILVGGIVRTTGSGMGCPDWPKCFGQVVPPTSIEQLPSDYKEIYKNKRVSKNQRVAKILRGLGFSEVSDRILNDPQVFEEQEFNVTKTWIEYINRIIGVIIGLLITAVLVASYFVRKEFKRIMLFAFLAFFLVVFQGWLGSLVVSTNLLPGMITAHMLLSMVLVGILFYMSYTVSVKEIHSINIDKKKLTLLRLLVAGAIILLFGQIGLGTQVREMIDIVAMQFADRNDWVEAVGNSFLIHRSYSWIILALQVSIAYLLYKNVKDSLLNRMIYSLTGLIVLEILTGIVLAYFAVPAFAQPIHLLLATIIFGIQYYAFLHVNAQYKLVRSN